MEEETKRKTKLLLWCKKDSIKLQELSYALLSSTRFYGFLFCDFVQCLERTNKFKKSGIEKTCSCKDNETSNFLFLTSFGFYK